MKYLQQEMVTRGADQEPVGIQIPNVLSPRECSGIVKYGMEKGNYSDGLLGMNAGDKQNGIRRTRLWWFHHDELKDKIMNQINKYNDQHWRFNLTACEFFQLGWYDKNCHYSWHQDYTPSVQEYHRKVSFSLILNDTSEWEGGDLQVLRRLHRDGTPLIQTMKKLEQGSLCIFPSSTYHRVTPVTSGNRISLVGWVWGPRFT